MEPKSIKEILDEIDISKYPEDLPIDYQVRINMVSERHERHDIGYGDRSHERV